MKPTIVIVGPTASGKSDLAHQLALAHNGAILCADARTINRYANIGTAKPGTQQRQEVSYYGLDIVELDQTYSAFAFQQYAQKIIKQCRNAGQQLLIVGGTGLYIDSLVYDFSFRSKPDAKLRGELEALSIEELQHRVQQLGIAMPRNYKNPRHLIRAIETKGAPALSRPLKQDFTLIGLLPPDEILKKRIHNRVEAMFRTGFIDEVAFLLTLYSKSEVASAGIGYHAALEYLDGNLTADQAKEIFFKGDWQYARRQKTWFKRNKEIKWFESSSKALTHIEQLLNHKQ